MMNTLRCFISCILPCGSLDVIRIVHVNGRVEDISGTIKASEIMKANPRHVLKASCYDVDVVTECPKIVILSPDVELQRGRIYFLVPDPKRSGTSCSKPCLKKSCKRSGNVMSWRPRLDSICEAASDA